MKPLSPITLSLIASVSLFNALNAESNLQDSTHPLTPSARDGEFNPSLRDSNAESWQSTNDSAESNATESQNPQSSSQTYEQSQRYNKLIKDNDNIETKQLDKVSVTAQVSQSELPIEFQSKQISIVNKDALLEKITLGGAQSALESVPGILYSRSGGINGQISIRGQNSNNYRSVIMIDGVRYTGRNTLDFNVLDPSQFESIEVIRGAASALWGSDAFNGVVNFRSRTSNYNLGAESFKATARIRNVEYNSVNHSVAGRAEILGGGRGFDLLIGASGRIGGDYTTPLKEQGKYLKAQNSNYQSFNVDFNAGYTNKNSTRFYAQGRYSHIESHRAGGLGTAPGSSYGILMSEVPINEYFLRFGARAQNLKLADIMDSYVYWRHWDTDIWNDRRGFNNNNNIHQQVYDNNYVGARMLFDKRVGKHFLSYGLDIESSISLTQVRQNNLTNNQSNTTNRPSTNTDFAIFVKDDWKASDKLILSGALRGDYVLTTISKKRSTTENNALANGNGGQQVQQNATQALDNNSIIHNGALTGSLGYVWFMSDYASNIFNISHNFRNAGAGTRMSTTPSGSSTLTTANPNIKPEYSQSAEFGFRFQSENHFASIIGFFTNYLDMIILSSYQSATIINSNTYRYENVGRAFITGAELEGRHSFLDSKILFNYVLSYNFARDITHNKPIAYVAPLYGNLSLKFNFDKAYFVVAERFYGSKTRIDRSEERRRYAYAMTDIYAGLKLGAFKSYLKDMELIFGVSNLFNQIGRNPVTAENVSRGLSLTNPLVEPARNFSLKYVWKY